MVGQAIENLAVSLRMANPGFGNIPPSVLQPNPPQQYMESWLAAQCIVAGVHFQADYFVRVFYVSFLKPLESFVLFTKSQVRPCQKPGIKCLSLTYAKKFLQRVAGFSGAIGPPVSISEVAPIPVIGRKSPSSLHASNSFVKHSLFNVSLLDELSALKLRIDLQYRAPLFNGVIILPRVIGNCAIIRSDDQRQWIELPCPLTLGQRLIKPASPHQVLRVPLVPSSIVGVQFNGPPKFPLRHLPVPVIVLGYQRQRRMSFRKSPVNLQGFQCCSPGPCHILPLGSAAVAPKQGVCIRNSGKRTSLTLIFDCGLLIIGNCLFHGRNVPLVQKVLAP